MEWGRQMVFVNHFYFYLWDPEWGAAFWKTNAYAPFPIWLWLNGHSWAQRQLQKAGIAFDALDNGFSSCADPAALQRICNRLGASAVHAFFWRWFHRLPSPFTADDLQAGYAYELAFRQFEVADTRVFDRPQTGRAFFEGVIRDHLDVGRPDQVVLIFDRKLMPRTPGRFTTRVVTRGVHPQLYCTYKSSRLKQYFKLGKALRTETVIGDTRDFGIGRRVCALNWNALRAVGDSANRRLCDAEAQSARPAPDVVTLTHVTRPSTTTDGLHAPALAFGDPRVMALLAALVLFTHALDGFDNRQLVKLVGRVWDQPYSSRQATYDLPDSVASRLSLACHIHTAITSRQSVGALASCSPRPTAESSRPPSRCSTPRSRPTLLNAALWLTHGANSTVPSTTSSNTNSSQPDNLISL